MTKDDLRQLGSIGLKDAEALVKEAGREQELIVVRDYEAGLVLLQLVVEVLAELTPVQGRVERQQLVHEHWQRLLHGVGCCVGADRIARQVG